MMKRWVPVVVVAALALILVNTGTSHAQRLFGRSGWSGGNWGGGGWGANTAWGGYGPGYGYGSGYSPSLMGYNTSSYWPNTYTFGNYGTWPNTYAYNTYNYGMSPYYYGNTYAYGTPTFTGTAYAYGTPNYTGGTTLYSPSSYALMPQNYVSFYPPTFPQGSPAVGSTTNNNQSLIEVRVPADAQVFFDGEPTQQQGTDRLFTSPPLEPGKRYHYDVKATWSRDGRTEEKTRTVHVEAGKQVTVDFAGAGTDRDIDRTQDRNLDRTRDQDLNRIPDRTRDQDLNRAPARTQDRNLDRTPNTPNRTPDRSKDRNP